MATERDPYLLGYRQAEQDRLERQADELAGESDWLFDRIGVGAGWRVIEIGCGPRGCLSLLSKRVGPAGSVVGVERSGEQAERARRFVAESGLTNVDVLNADARRLDLPERSFDLATARLVLTNVPQPEEVLAEMVRLVRPGGFVALHEPDPSAARCDPPLAEQVRLLELLKAYAQLHGIDRSIGLRVPRMLRELGLLDVQVHPFVDAYPPDHGRRMLLLDFVDNARERMLERGLVGVAELDDLTATVRRHFENPLTLVLSSLFLQTWGRVPDPVGRDAGRA